MIQEYLNDDEMVFETSFLQIKKTADNYFYMHEKYCEGQVVAVVPFKKAANASKFEYLARFEICPAHGKEPELCSITGGKISGSSAEYCACQKILQKAGLTVTEKDLIPLGLVKPSKASDTRAYLFAVNVTGKQRYIQPGNGEQAIETIWIDYEKAIEVEDPLLITILTRLHALL